MSNGAGVRRLGGGLTLIDLPAASKSKRFAFTLVELLVVIAIIGILVALLLPAIQAARESARRLQCQNQLKQIGVALHSHVDSYKVFPTGGAEYNPLITNYISNGKPFGPDKQGLAWAYQILPYLEEGAIQGLITNDDLQKATLPIYVCPTRRTVNVAQAVSLNVGNKWIFLADYAAAQPCTVQCPAGVAGCPSPVPRYNAAATSPLTRTAYNANAASFWGGRYQSKPLGANNQVYDGVIVRSAWDRVKKRFYLNQALPTKIAKITDGTSHTFLIGEKYVRPDLYGGGSWSDDKGWSDGWDLDVLRSTCFPAFQDNDPVGYSFLPLNSANDIFGNAADVYYFGAAHTAGFNGIFADGSVHALAFDIDVVIFNSLATRSGDEIVPSDAI